MKNNEHTGAESGTKFRRDLSDEDLFRVRKSDKAYAENELCRRYITFRHFYLKFIMQSVGMYLDELSMTDAFMVALAVSVRKFKPDEHCLFKTYFVNVLRHELLKECKTYGEKRSILSLECNLRNDGENEFCLCDVVPTAETPVSSPKLYLGFVEIEEAIRSLRREQQWIARGVVKYLSSGSTLRKAAEQMNVTYSRARYTMDMLAYELKKRGITL